MSTAYYDYSVDPVTNQIYPVILRSASKGGTTTLKIGVVDVNVPAAANFPSNFTTSTPTRYFVELPMDAYWTSTNTAGFTVRNETQGRALTVVTPAAALTDYTCKFGSSSAEKKSILEVHVGSTSNMANDTLSYEGYFAGTVLKSTLLDHVQLGSITFNSTSTIEGNIYQTAGYKVATNGETAPDVDLGGVTLYSTANKYMSVKTVQTSHGITSETETDTKFMVRDAGAGGFGGIKIQAFSTLTEPFIFESYRAGTTAVTNAFVFDAFTSTGGTGSTSIPLSNTLASFDNKGTQVFKITGGGSITASSAITSGAQVNSTFGFVVSFYDAGSGAITNDELQTAFGASNKSTSCFVGITVNNNSGIILNAVFTYGTTNYWIAPLTKLT